MLVGCQSDALHEDRLNYENRARQIMSRIEWKKYNPVYCQCSAATGDNVENVFNTAAELVYQSRSTSVVKI